MRWWLRRVLRRVFLLLVILLAAFLILRGRYRTVIQELAETQVKNSTSDLTNDAIAKQIAESLKTDILNIINDEILALDTSDIGVPLGSLFFPEFLSGKGPAIPGHILSIRNSDASFVSDFSQAGINQTLQKLTMNISVDVAILVLGKSENFTVSSQVVVAETIIVGQVPDTLLQGGGSYGSKTEN